MTLPNLRLRHLSTANWSNLRQRLTPGTVEPSSPKSSSVFGFLLLGLESSPDPEHVPIGMAKVHLANIPRHIGGRKCDLQPGGDAMLVHLIHVIYPDRHPD